MVLIKYGPVHCELRAFFFFSSRRRHTRWPRDWSSDVCSSDLTTSWLVHPAGLSIRTRPWPDGSVLGRSEERRVGKESKTRGTPRESKKEEKVKRKNDAVSCKLKGGTRKRAIVTPLQ